MSTLLTPDEKLQVFFFLEKAVKELFPSKRLWFWALAALWLGVYKRAGINRLIT
jgi:hypothetical protein